MSRRIAIICGYESERAREFPALGDVHENLALIGAAIRSEGYGHFDDVSVAGNVEEALAALERRLQTSRSGDRVLFYFTGETSFSYHRDDEVTYLAIALGGSRAWDLETALGSADRVAGRQVLLVLDGTALEGIPVSAADRCLVPRRETSESLRMRDLRVVVSAASRAEGSASAAARPGEFATAFAAALRESEADLDGDGIVWDAELARHARARLRGGRLFHWRGKSPLAFDVAHPGGRPALEDAERALRCEFERARSTEPPLVLIVEDNEDNVITYATILRHFDYRVVDARNGEEAIAMARTLRPHAILMDVSIPIIDGWEATQFLKHDPETRDIIIVALTAHALASDRERAMEVGCDGYLAKPCEPRALVAELRRVIPSFRDGRWAGAPPTGSTG